MLNRLRDDFLFSDGGIKGWLKLAVLGVIALYVLCMLVAPWFYGGWDYVQSVWGYWQSFNAAFLAFVSSLIAFYISRFKEMERRRRELISARSFLPHALSELTAYLRKSSETLAKVYQYLATDEDRMLYTIPIPVPPEGYKEVFRECIKLAEPDLANYLSQIVMLMQVHEARLVDHIKSASLSKGDRPLLLAENTVFHMLELAELMRLVNNLFDYSRGERAFGLSSVSASEFNQAYFSLGVHVQDFDKLSEITARAIERNKGGWRLIK